MKAVLNAISAIYRTVNKNRQGLNSISIQLPNLIISRDSTQNKPLGYGQTLYKNLSDAKPPLIFPNSNGFAYENDVEMSTILKIENMFENTGNLDFKIIYYLLSGSTNHIICDKLFIPSKHFNTIRVSFFPLLTLKQNPILSVFYRNMLIRKISAILFQTDFEVPNKNYTPHRFTL